MRNRIEFWLKFNNGAETIQLPVNPETVTVSTEQQYDDLEVSKIGEYTVIGDEKLKEFSFESFLPRDYNPSFCEYESIPAPWDVVKKLERWRNERDPCRFIVTNTSINYAVTIRDFEYDPERAGNPGDIFFRLTLKEYRFLEFEEVDVPEAPENEIEEEETETATAKRKQKKERPNEQKPGESYTVDSGDNLSKIALKYQNQGVDVSWEDIYERNKDTIGKDPNQIQPGMDLTIPGKDGDFSNTPYPEDEPEGTEETDTDDGAIAVGTAVPRGTGDDDDIAVGTAVPR